MPGNRLALSGNPFLTHGRAYARREKCARSGRLTAVLEGERTHVGKKGLLLAAILDVERLAVNQADSRND
jgi:hypothetical protein